LLLLLNSPAAVSILACALLNLFRSFPTFRLRQSMAGSYGTRLLLQMNGQLFGHTTISLL
jgi:hypothetical protein